MSNNNINNINKHRGGAVEVDYDNIIDKLTSLITVVVPSHGSLLDISDMVHAPASVSSSPPQQHIKLDREVCETLSQDIEKTKDNNKLIDSILRQFLDFAGSNKPPETRGMGGNDTGGTTITGDTAKLAASTSVLNPLTKMEWMAHICNENSVALDNLSTVLESRQQIWNLFPKAIYCSLDCMVHLFILWRQFGAYVNVQALASGKTDDALLDHDNPQVVHARQEIRRLLEMRKKLTEAVPVTEILLDLIIPVVKAIEEKQCPLLARLPD